jgi:hypothetical protein
MPVLMLSKQTDGKHSSVLQACYTNVFARSVYPASAYLCMPISPQRAFVDEGRKEGRRRRSEWISYALHLISRKRLIYIKLISPNAEKEEGKEEAKLQMSATLTQTHVQMKLSITSWDASQLPLHSINIIILYVLKFCICCCLRPKNKAVAK